jgi:hypothetical protein
MQKYNDIELDRFQGLNKGQLLVIATLLFRQSSEEAKSEVNEYISKLETPHKSVLSPTDPPVSTILKPDLQSVQVSDADTSAIAQCDKIARVDKKKKKEQRN